MILIHIGGCKSVLFSIYFVVLFVNFTSSIINEGTILIGICWEIRCRQELDRQIQSQTLAAAGNSAKNGTFIPRDFYLKTEIFLWSIFLILFTLGTLNELFTFKIFKKIPFQPIFIRIFTIKSNIDIISSIFEILSTFNQL